MDLKNIKSWHIAATGAILQVILHILFAIIDFVFFMETIMIAIGIPLGGLIITALFYFKKTSIIGAVTSIILAISIILLAIEQGRVYVLVLAPLFPLILIAGIYYFWKKV